MSILPQAVNPPCKTPEVPAVTGSEVSREQPVISLADHSDRHVGSICNDAKICIVILTKFFTNCLRGSV
jgi:hypothetical protein